MATAATGGPRLHARATWRLARQVHVACLSQRVHARVLRCRRQGMRHAGARCIAAPCATSRRPPRARLPASTTQPAQSSTAGVSRRRSMESRRAVRAEQMRACLERALHAARIQLPLPARVRGAVVLDAQQVARRSDARRCSFAHAAMVSQAAAASPQAAPSCAPGGALEWQCCTGLPARSLSYDSTQIGQALLTLQLPASSAAPQTCSSPVRRCRRGMAQCPPRRRILRAPGGRIAEGTPACLPSATRAHPRCCSARHHRHPAQACRKRCRRHPRWRPPAFPMRSAACAVPNRCADTPLRSTTRGRRRRSGAACHRPLAARSRSGRRERLPPLLPAADRAV